MNVPPNGSPVSLPAAVVRRWWRWLGRSPPKKESPRPVLVLVEGIHDAAFLRRISDILSAAQAEVPSLARLEQTGEIVILPLGGNGPQPWLHQLEPLGRAAFSLFDREMPPESEQRYQAVSRLNTQPRQRAFVTGKRSLENYLHSQAIYQAREVWVALTDDSDVADLVARALLRRKGFLRDWTSLPSRTRKRLRAQAKQWLNREAVEQMTPELLHRSDPDGEVVGWLRAIAELVHSQH